MHKTKQGALKAARDALGGDAIEGCDFNLHNTGAGWSFEEIPPANEAAKVARATKAKAFIDGKVKVITDTTGLVEVKDIGANSVWVKPDENLVVDGVLQPNKARATEAKKPKAVKAAKTAVEGPVSEKKLKAVSKAQTPKSDGATKGSMILAMLRRKGGATSKQMEEAAGWKPHSVRGYLGTLRAKGVNVISTKEPKHPTVYSIGEVGDVV